MARATIRPLLLSTILLCMAAIAAKSLTAQASPVSGNPGPIRSNAPVLIELFTSQGCSSCPPADRLAAKLAKEKGLVVISRPVDYWDRLGWKDTLAKPENTALQRTYAKRGLGGYNGVYTPQTVVAGTYGEVGSDERAVRAQVRTLRAKSPTAQLRVKRAGSEGYGVGLAGSPKRPAQLVLMGVASRSDIAIGRGENRGRTVRYTNTLIDEELITTWKGGTKSLTLTSDRLRMKGADRYALVLREPAGGKVLAARWLD